MCHHRSNLKSVLHKKPNSICSKTWKHQYLWETPCQMKGVRWKTTTSIIPTIHIILKQNFIWILKRRKTAVEWHSGCRSWGRKIKNRMTTHWIWGHFQVKQRHWQPLTCVNLQPTSPPVICLHPPGDSEEFPCSPTPPSHPPSHSSVSEEPLQPSITNQSMIVGRWRESRAR